MKDHELRPCDLCGGPLPLPGLPLAGIEIRFARMAVDRRAADRFAGMSTFFGGAPALARVFETDDLIVRIGEKEGAAFTRALVCESCLGHTETPLDVRALMEVAK